MPIASFLFHKCMHIHFFFWCVRSGVCGNAFSFCHFGVQQLLTSSLNCRRHPSVHPPYPLIICARNKILHLLLEILYFPFLLRFAFYWHFLFGSSSSWSHSHSLSLTRREKWYIQDVWVAIEEAREKERKRTSREWLLVVEVLWLAIHVTRNGMV